MSEAKRSKVIAFRLTDEEYTQLENTATASGDEPNNWCRNLALTTGRLIYTELAILRFLIGHGFKLLFRRNAADAADWTKLTTQADQRSAEIVQELLSRRKYEVASNPEPRCLIPGPVRGTSCNPCM